MDSDFYGMAWATIAAGYAARPGLGLKDLVTQTDEAMLALEARVKNRRAEDKAAWMREEESKDSSRHQNPRGQEVHPPG